MGRNEEDFADLVLSIHFFAANHTFSFSHHVKIRCRCEIVSNSITEPNT